MHTYQGKKIWIYDDKAPFRESNVTYKLLSEVAPQYILDYLFRIGISDYKIINSFVERRNIDFSDLYENLMKDAVLLFDKAVRENRPIYIYTDYDADGVTSASMLVDFLGKYMNYRLNQNLFYRVSDREYGYGINPECVKDVISNFRRSLIFILDTGNSNLAEINEMLINTNSYIIHIDHHNYNQDFDILATRANFTCVNPKRTGQNKYYNLSTGALTYFFISFLDNHYNLGGITREYLDIAAVSVISDYMTMDFVNRHIVSEGVRVFNENKRPIFYLLGDLHKYDTNVDVNNFGTIVGFYIAPKINAAGRANRADLAMAAVLSGLSIETNISQLMALVEQLKTIYYDTKNMRDNVYTEIVQNLGLCYTQPEGIVFYQDDNLDAGIISAIASKISGEYKVPTIVGKAFNNIFKGSGRIPGFLGTMYNIDVLKYLNQIDGLSMYGHNAAFGIHAEINKIESIRKEITGIQSELKKYSYVIGSGKEFVDHIIDSKEALSDTYEKLTAIGPAKNRDEAPKILIPSSMLHNSGDALYILNGSKIYNLRVDYYDKKLTHKINPDTHIVVTPLIKNENSNFRTLQLEDVVTTKQLL